MNWRISSVVIGIAIIASGIAFASSKILGEKFEGVFSQKFGEFFSKRNTDDIIMFDAMLDIDIIEFKTFIKKMEINFIPGSIHLGGEKFDFSSNYVLKLKNFNGLIKINIKNKTISINGYMERALINDIRIFPHENEKISINAENTNFETVKLFNVSINEFSYNSSGKINIKNKVSIQLHSEILKINDYIGNLEIADIVKMKGIANKLFVLGKLKIAIND